MDKTIQPTKTHWALATVNNDPAEWRYTAADNSSSTTVTGTYLPGEYINGDQMIILFRFQSDGDCPWPIPVR